MTSASGGISKANSSSGRVLWVSQSPKVSMVRFIGKSNSTRSAVSSRPCLLLVPQLLASGLSFPRLSCLFSQRGGILVVFPLLYLIFDSLFDAGIPEPLQGGVD